VVLRGVEGDWGVEEKEEEADEVKERKSVVALLLWRWRSSCLYWPCQG